MTPELPPLVLRTLQRFIRAFAPERILLFGSYAKGTTRLRSDVDLLIVADLPGSSAVHIRRARQLAANCFPRIDIVFATPQEVASADTAKSPFLSSILGTGIVVYRKD
jgi:predicted nucleotidyltransferase